jgi:hypothetical protein
MHDAASAEAEQDNARDAKEVIRKKYGLKHNDMNALISEALAAEKFADEVKRRQQSAAAAPKTKGAKVEALSLVHHLLQKYIGAKPHEYVGLALWALHTHVADRFDHTPRLLLRSPEPECGKTNAFKILGLLTYDNRTTGSISTAAFRNLVNGGHTVFADEAEHFCDDPGALHIVNAGFEKSGSTQHRHNAEYNIFGPLALGAIGSLPATVMSRSLDIKLFRAANPERFPVFDREDEKMRKPFDDAYTLITKWAETVQLSRSPEMPAGMQGGRYAQKWRPLISIADSFDPEWGKRARQAAFAFRDHRADRVVQTMMLMDCEKVRKGDFLNDYDERISSEKLVTELLELEDAEYPWTDYRGLKGDRPERKLNKTSMAELLDHFDIQPTKIRFHKGPKGSLQGYHWEQFEPHWASHQPPPDGTPEQPKPEPEEPKLITKPKSKPKSKLKPRKKK